MTLTIIPVVIGIVLHTWVGPQAIPNVISFVCFVLGNTFAPFDNFLLADFKWSGLILLFVSKKKIISLGGS